MSYNIITDEPMSTPVRTDVSTWITNYKEQFIEHSHDQSTFSLVTPDDSLIFIGPPRLAGKDHTEFYAVGFVNSFNYSEQSQVQPMKAIGSRRHIFARTNAPVQGSIGRVMVLGSNLYRALYAMTGLSDKIANRNSKFSVGDTADKSSWYTNLEEDLFRVPFGLGIIYNSPASIAADQNKQSAGAEYIEMIQLQNRSVGFQAGGAMIMEQVSFVADRVVPWHGYSGPEFNVGASGNIVGEMMGG